MTDMRATSPSALFASLTLHALIVVAIFLLTILFSRLPPAPPVIFELVAGAPTDAVERAAPASVQLTVPKVTLPKETPPAIVETPPAPVEKKVEQKKPVPKEEPKKAPPTKQETKVSYEQFVKQHGAPQPVKTAPPRITKAPQVDTSKVLDSRPTTGERGTAQARDEADAMLVYLAGLRDRLREAHEQTKPAGLGDSVSADVSFFLAVNGQIDNVRIVRSSGFAEFDESVLAAFRRITWPGARPDKKNETMRLTFRMREQ